MKSKQVLLVSLLVVGCAPTLAGQLHGAGGEQLASREARINVTPLTPQADPAQSGGLVIQVDEQGHFATKEQLPPGVYLVEALVPGYAPQSQKINLATTNSIELTLKPLAAVKIKTTSASGGVDEGRGAGSATLTPPSL